RDSIIAHEMAHIANGSLWLSAATVPIACSVGALALATGVSTWFWVAFASHVSIWRIISRRIERDCDLKAAQAVGFPEEVSKLTKIHKINGDFLISTLWQILSAVESHPGLASRIAHLRRHAPADVREKIESIGDDGVTESRTAWTLVFSWLIAIGVGWQLGQSQEIKNQLASSAILIATSLAPALIKKLIVWKLGIQFVAPDSRHCMNRWIVALPLLGLIGLISASNVWEWEWVHQTYLLSIVIIGLCVMAFLPVTRQTSIDSFHTAWERLDFERVITIASNNPKWLMKDPGRRIMVAKAKAAIGNHQDGLSDFRIVDRQGLLPNEELISYVALQVEELLADEATKTITRIKAAFPDTGLGEAVMSRLLRKTGRLEEAQKVGQLALEINPKFGAVWAAAAGIEVELGNFDKAKEFLLKAQELEPGTPQELAESARLAFHNESPDVAREKLERAIAAFKSNPLMLRPSEIVSLQSLLDQLNGRRNS
ncbi:MAG: tetratricopeptide repeat protein, partial [Planctomycetes bacterium]|nr:tetratricopeptide repeat protein [Planctomycetota bacterium]